MEEIWKDIIGYAGRYQVSNLGRVKSFAVYSEGIILKPGIRKAYLKVVLSKGDGSTTTVSIHRLVAEAFIPNPDNLPIVMHLDDDPKNNTVTNLQWGSFKDNMEDMTKKHRAPRGSEQYLSILDEAKVIEIRSRLTGKRGELVSLGKEYGVTPECISSIKRNITWKHV